jgi:hypothetical protein
MTVLNLPKTFGEVQEASLLNEDWYLMRVVEEPKVEPNAQNRAQAKGEPHDPEKVGHNFVIKLKIEADDPMINGRPFTKYLSLPNDHDSSRFHPLTGQDMVDWKLEQIRKWGEAFAGQPIADDSAEISVAEGDRAYIFVSTAPDFRSGEDRNELDMNKDPKPVG